MSAADYWISLFLVQAAGWALLVGAGFRLRRGWREDRGEMTVPARATVDGCKAEIVQPARRPLGDEADPIARLFQRQRGLSAILWAGALFSLAYHGLILVVFRFMRPSLYSVVGMPLELARTALEGALFAWAASRFFVEARRTGELELLLTTPLGAKQIVSAQWEVLRRRLRWPMLVMVAPVFLQVAVFLATTSVGSGLGISFGLHYAISGLVGCLNIVFGVGALCWLGLWFGLQAGGQGRAIAWTVSVVKGPPYLVSILGLILLAGLASAFAGGRSWLYWTRMWVPQVADLLFYIGLIYVARRRLLRGLAGAELMRFDLREFMSSAARGALAALRRARHWTPS